MPPKSKLHKSTGKLKSMPTSTRNESNELELSPEATQQLELELCWCIQQLQTALKSGKLNSKQVQDHTKSLNTLMSNSTSLVKKRQVMRLSFGDYRAKMAAEEKKSNPLSSKIKISQANPSKKSMFLKKSPFVASNNSFRFNFPENIAIDMSNFKIENSAENSEIINDADNNFHYKPSDNSFRFNFEISEQ